MKVLEWLEINNGSVLVDGKISSDWAHVLFWRSFLAMTLHYIAILMIGSLSLKLGVVNNLQVDTKIEELLDRPTEETATMFSFVKQQFYHKSLAYTKYEKDKLNKGNKKCC